MPVTAQFKNTVKARAARDPEFRKALLEQSIETLLSGDLNTGKAMLRDYINATIGFEKLGVKTRKSPKSLMRMLSPLGNPRADNIFAVLKTLQGKEGVRVQVQTV